MPEAVTLQTNISIPDSSTNASVHTRQTLMRDLANARTYQARMDVIQAFVTANPDAFRDLDTSSPAALRMIALNLLMRNEMGTNSYNGMQNYFRLFVGDTTHDDLLAAEVAAVRSAHVVHGRNMNWEGDYVASIFDPETLATGGTAARGVLNTAGLTSTAYPVTATPTMLQFSGAVSTPIMPVVVTTTTLLPDQLTTRNDGIALAQTAGIPLAAINNPRHSFWTSDEGRDPEIAPLYAQLFPHVTGDPDPAQVNDTYRDAAFTPFVVAAVAPTLPTPVTTTTVLPITGVVPLTAPVIPSSDILAVNGIGQIALPALPERYRYTGTPTQINRAMFNDVSTSLDMLATVASRSTTTPSTLGRDHVGLNQQDFRNLYNTLRSFDPNNPDVNRSVVTQQLLQLGFNATEISLLLANPALLQTMARTASAISHNTQFGSVAALNADNPAEMSTTAPVVTEGDLRALHAEMGLLSNGATDQGTGTGGIPHIDPMQPHIARHAGAFLRARILANVVIFNPNNRSEVVGAVATSTYANWEAFQSPASELTGLLVGAMRPDRPGGHLAQFGENEALALQALLSPTEPSPTEFTRLCAILHFNEADIARIRAIRSNATNLSAAFATSTWMVSSLQRGELQALHSPTSGTNPPGVTRDDLMALDAVLRSRNPQDTIVLAGMNRTNVNTAIAGLYASATTTSGVVINNRASVPYITQPPPTVLASSTSTYTPVINYNAGMDNFAYSGMSVATASYGFSMGNNYDSGPFGMPMNNFFNSGSDYGFNNNDFAYSGVYSGGMYGQSGSMYDFSDMGGVGEGTGYLSGGFNSGSFPGVYASFN